MTPRRTSSNRKSESAAASNPPQASRTRIMLVDDHPMMRAGLAQFINKQPDLEICCEFSHANGALEGFHKFHPQLVLTDITLPDRSGIELIKDLLAAKPDLTILVVSMHDETVYAERVLRAGARGYIMKESGGENLLTAIRQVLGGRVYVSPQISARILDNLAAGKPRGSHSPVEKLSDREFEVFQLLGRGKSTREIATQLRLSHKTVEAHRSHIKEKLELKDAIALMHHAVRWVESQDRGE
jgi:DNA-binding NarL/FixJ family response regulator